MAYPQTSVGPKWALITQSEGLTTVMNRPNQSPELALSKCQFLAVGGRSQKSVADKKKARPECRMDICMERLWPKLHKLMDKTFMTLRLPLGLSLWLWLWPRHTEPLRNSDRQMANSWQTLWAKHLHV